jgi:DNA helicase-2/ATP-dependent DNA helicase PcrA
VVGDDDQSIYGWRGADVRNILEFEQHFPGAKVVKLEDNYRSRAAVLNVANAAIANSAHKRHQKSLRAARGHGDKVRMVACDDPGHEARFVAEEIKDLHRDDRLPYRDIAILYRSNLQARLIEEELRANGIPYQLFGGTQFFDRKEVKDAAAYLRVAVNPLDDMSLRRILNYPPRGIGDTTVERIDRLRLARGISFSEAVRRAEGMEDVPDNARRSIRQLNDMLAKMRARFEAGRDMAQGARELFDGVGLKDALRDGDDPQGARRWENIEFLLRSMERYEARPGEEKPTLAQFLARITLKRDEEEEESGEPNQVTLSTLHGSKGLEFHTVFFIGCVEGQLPHSRTTDPKVTEAAPVDVDEERRLFYVGVTRARDRLYISTFKRRMLRGQVTPAAPSRFLDGLPEESIEAYARANKPALDTNEVADLADQLLAQLRNRPAAR